MSTMDLVPNMPLSSYIDAQNGYVQPLSMDLLGELSWPCEFMSPSLTPQYMDMPNYPLSPISPESMAVASQAQGITIHRQRQGPPPLSSRPSISSIQISGSSNFPKKDRERRKAQNRASQRAYRERKEVQLRDLAASLKETETAMAEAKHENEQLDAMLEKMKNELEVLREENEVLREENEVLRRENEVLRRTDGVQEGLRADEKVTSTQQKGVNTGMIQGEPTPPHFEEGYDGGTRSNTTSVIATPKDMELDGFEWDRALLESKKMPMVGPSMVEVEREVFW